MLYDTVISGGTIHTATASFTGDIGIREGIIAAVSASGRLGSTGCETIDATGMDVIPGCIDPHVHLALPFCGTVSCDDFDSGSRAAAAGGVTTVIDFAIPSAGQSLADAHDTWRAKAEGLSRVDYAWHLAMTHPEHLREIPAMIDRGLPTFKQFMIYESEGWNADDAMIYGALELLRQHRGMLLIHAESPRVLDLFIRRAHTPDQMRRYGAKLHAMTRPPLVEIEAIERVIRRCDATRGPLYIVHMSTGVGADLVRQAQARGVRVFAETCAQYLTLDDSVFDHASGHLFACCPQVKSKADIARLWNGLLEGNEISVVSTDTCSFTRKQKDMWWDQATDCGDFTKIPMGLPGLDTLVPLMYTLGVRDRKMSMNRLVQLCSTNPANLMGLGHRKGQLTPGFDADIVLIDPSFRREIIPQGQERPATVQSRCDWSPYAGMTLHGFAHTTFVRGVPVVRDYRITGEPTHGQFLERSNVTHL